MVDDIWRYVYLYTIYVWLQSNLSWLWDGSILVEGIEGANEKALEVIKLQISFNFQHLILQIIKIITSFYIKGFSHLISHSSLPSISLSSGLWQQALHFKIICKNASQFTEKFIKTVFIIPIHSLKVAQHSKLVSLWPQEVSAI